MTGLSAEARATVLVALLELALEMERRHAYATLPFIGSKEKREECERVLQRLVRAEREVRAL